MSKTEEQVGRRMIGMARPLRVWFPGAMYHLTIRGNSQENIFCDDNDRARYLDILKRYKDKYKFKLYCYTLMDNHIHLLLETGSTSISKTMQTINTAYTVYFNKKYERVGHLFQGRFKGIIVDKDSYLLEVSRYIHLNPVRAKLVEKPESYLWSSYRIYVGHSTSNLVDSSVALALLGDSNREKYKEFVEDGVGKEISLPRISIRAGQWYIGSTKFIRKAEKQVAESSG